MKRINNIYSQIYDLNNIYDMYLNSISPNTKNKDKVEKYENYFTINIMNVKRMLETRRVIFNNYFIFIIKEPKYRIIMSQSINDKLINHLCAKYLLLDVFEPSLIDSNVATRTGKGTHYGVKTVKKYINKIKTNNKKIYYLKCDISKYFYSIKHDKLFDIIKSKIKDEFALEITKKIIDTSNRDYINDYILKLKNKEIEHLKKLNLNYKELKKHMTDIEKIPTFDTPGIGIPIGNMTSQAFAIIYLNDLDHYIKEQLHIKYYVRYMDDFVLLHSDKNYLIECYKKIKQKLEIEFFLKLNPKSKIDILNNKNSLDFLGYRFYLSNTNKVYLKIRNSTKRRFKKKMRKMYKLYNSNKINYRNFKQVMSSYHGHFMHANSYYFLNHYFKVNNNFEPHQFGKFVRIDWY